METLIITGLMAASGMDLKYRKIPNLITFSLAAAGFLISCTQYGWNGAAQSFLGIALGFFLLIIPFSLGAMGGGDVKLLAALGACLGPSHLFHVFLASAIAGGALSLIEVTRQKAWAFFWESMKNRLTYFALSGNLPHERQICFTSKPLHIPYAIAIALGYLGLFLSGGLT